MNCSVCDIILQTMHLCFVEVCKHCLWQQSVFHWSVVLTVALTIAVKDLSHVSCNQTLLCEVVCVCVWEAITRLPVPCALLPKSFKLRLWFALSLMFLQRMFHWEFTYCMAVLRSRVNFRATVTLLLDKNIIRLTPKPTGIFFSTLTLGQLRNNSAKMKWQVQLLYALIILSTLVPVV